MKKKVAVIFGGRSVEHEISIITALQMMEAIDSTKIEVIPIYITPKGVWVTGKALFTKKSYANLPQLRKATQEVTCLPKPGGGLVTLPDLGPLSVDVCLLAFHGQYGEDGAIQGLLEMAGIPYTSCSTGSSAIAMDKAWCKGLLKGLEIPSLPFEVVTWHLFVHHLEVVLLNIYRTFGEQPFPLFVKPCRLGSSIGLFKAEDEEGLIRALAGVFKYDRKAIVEPFVKDLMEINIAVYSYRGYFTSPVEIPIPEKEVLTFNDKYKRPGGKGASLAEEGMAGLTRIINPKNLPKELIATVEKYALKAFDALNCRGVVRFDFMVDKKTNQLFFNELNSIPGSMAFYLWEEASPPLLYTDLIEQIIEEAILQKVEKESVDTDFGFTIIS